MRKMKRGRLLGIWKMIPLAIWWILGRRGINGFLRARLGPIKILNFIF